MELAKSEDSRCTWFLFITTNDK